MKTTIKDIARKLDLSANTVSKALRGKPQVSEETRALIFKTAQQMNYVPSEHARALVRKELRIAVVYPVEPHEFYRYIAQGVQAAKQELADHRCIVIEYPFESLERPDEFAQILDGLLNEDIHALILTCAHREEVYRDALRMIGMKGIPIFYNTIFGPPTANLIGGVRINTSKSGKIAAEYLNNTIPARSSRKVALLVGEKNLLVHRECIDGFCEDAGKYGFDVVGIYETYEERRLAYELTDRLMRLHPDLGGLYVTSYNSPGACDWFEEHPSNNHVVVIGHDLYPALNEKLRSRTLSATLFQNQFELARESLRVMFEYLTGTREESECTKLFIPQIVLSSMLDFFTYYDREMP